MKAYKLVGFILMVMLVQTGQLSSIAKTGGEIDMESMMDRYVSLIQPSRLNPDRVRLIVSMPQETFISDQMVKQLFELRPVERNEIETLVSQLTDEGTWTDIDYKGRKRSAWEPCVHVERIYRLCTAYNEWMHEPQTASLCPSLEKAIHKAMQAWFRMKLVCPNWWYNEIGVPLTMGKAALCFRKQLSAEELKGISDVLLHAKFGMTGQNRVWLAGIVLMRALLEGNADLVKQAQSEITAEITIGDTEGIQPDGSFRQHGPQQQFGNYGLSFITEMAFYANLFEGTEYAFTTDQRHILDRLMLEGYRYVTYGGRLEPNALGRQISNNVALQKGQLVLGSALNLLIGCPEEDRAGLSAFVEEMLLGHPGTKFVKQKYFPCINQTIGRWPQWMCSVKMASRSVIGMENVNQDNMKGFYTADGATFTMVRGDEYDNVFPLWDYRKVPGITSYHTSLPLPRADVVKEPGRLRNCTDLVGGLTMDERGITAMDFNRDGMRGRKCWVMTDDAVICLGAGIATDSTLAMTTSIDQRQPRKEVFVSTRNAGFAPMGKTFTWQDLSPRHPVRIYSDSICYIPCQGDTLTVSVEQRKGDWQHCIHNHPSEIVEGKMFTAYIRHDLSSPAKYAYIILPAVSRGEALRFKPSSVHFLRNDSEVQCVEYKGFHYVVCYAPVRYRLRGQGVSEEWARGLYIVCPDGKVLHRDF